MRNLSGPLPQNPALEDWTRKVKSAPDEDLIELQNANYLGLRDTGGEHLSLYVELVEEELRRRSISSQ